MSNKIKNGLAAVVAAFWVMVIVMLLFPERFGDVLSYPYALIIILGVIVTGIITAVMATQWTHKKDVPEWEYTSFDERQKLVQGMAYKASSLALAILILINSVLNEAADIRLFNSVAGAILMIYIGNLVYSFICIKNGAHTPIGVHEKRYTAIETVAGLLCMIVGLTAVRGGAALVENGVLASSANVFVVGAYFLTLAVENVFICAKNRGEDDE